MPKKKDGASPRRPRKKKPTPGVLTAPLAPTELTGEPPEELAALARRVEKDGGRPLAAYREPYGGKWVLFAALPIDRVSPTPYQRDLSKPHVARLISAISKIGRFLDPIIAVASPSDGYWTPNGNHRLEAMRAMNARSVAAIIVPEAAVAYQILALNTEKAHNLKEKSLEVVRMYEELAALGDQPETDYLLEFEESALITLGFCYQERPRFSGAVYHPILKRADRFLDLTLRKGRAVRQARSKALLAVDERVSENIEALKKRGFMSPYLRAFVVARINPIRFAKAAAAPDVDDVIARMAELAEKFDAAKIRPQDVGGARGAPSED